MIRNLFKILNNINDNSNFVKEFLPMIQGLLETFLQAKEEASFIKDNNEICYSVPAKLKNLLITCLSFQDPSLIQWSRHKQRSLTTASSQSRCGSQLWLATLRSLIQSSIVSCPSSMESCTRSSVSSLSKSSSYWASLESKRDSTSKIRISEQRTCKLAIPFFTLISQ